MVSYTPLERTWPHPVVLAFIARHVIAGAVEGAGQGYRVMRSELGDLVPPHAIDAALRAWRAEGERLAATACAVDLVERALRGETFRPRLLRSRSESGDRPELVGDKQRDQIPELVSAQLDLAAVVIYERDSPAQSGMSAGFISFGWRLGGVVKLVFPVVADGQFTQVFGRKIGCRVGNDAAIGQGADRCGAPALLQRCPLAQHGARA